MSIALPPISDDSKTVAELKKEIVRVGKKISSHYL